MNILSYIVIVLVGIAMFGPAILLPFGVYANIIVIGVDTVALFAVVVLCALRT